MREAAFSLSEKARPRRALHLVVLVVLGYVVAAGLYGVDFGPRWDEPKLMWTMQQVQEKETLLPGWYNYPSITYWLTRAATSRAVDRCLERSGGRGDEKQLARRCLNKLFASERGVKGRAFHRAVRPLFTVVSLLAVLWVYLASFRRRGSHGEALFAAATCAFSFELGYHARWIAPDAVLAMLAALALLFVVAAQGAQLPSRRRALLAAAAVAAGLACGTKYPGGLLLLPVVLAAIVEERAKEARPATVALVVVGVCAAFALTYLVTTPGTLFEHRAFLRDVRYEMRHYADEGHAQYTVQAGLEHLRLMFVYVTVVLPSRFWPLSIVLSLFAGAGIVALVVDDRRRALALLAFPLVYLAYMSLQRVMIVRNLLVILPSFAFFAGRGAVFVHELWSRRYGRGLSRSLVVVVALSVSLANAAWLGYAAYTIEQPPSDAARLARVLAFVDENPDEQIALSATLEAALARSKRPRPPNLTRGPTAAALVVADSLDSAHVNAWPTNWPWRYRQLGGPYDVNFNYYPSWYVSRVVVSSVSDARAAGVRF